MRKYEPYFFGVGTGVVKPADKFALDHIAQKHDVTFVAILSPEGPRYWFECQRRGGPFDAVTAAMVITEAKLSGIWPPQKVKGAA